MKCSLCAWMLTAFLSTLAPCQNLRHLTGKVLLPDGKPAQGAVVKLRDQTKDIRTAITAADGSFQFSRLLPDLDYQVRATFGNMESHHVSWSRLSSRTEKEVILILRPVRTPKASVQPLLIRGNPSLTVGAPIRAPSVSERVCVSTESCGHVPGCVSIIPRFSTKEAS
jgi:hypothetical protein